jgi:hypothetical protein
MLAGAGAIKSRRRPPRPRTVRLRGSGSIRPWAMTLAMLLRSIVDNRHAFWPGSPRHRHAGRGSSASCSILTAPRITGGGDMSEPTAPAGAQADEQAIRERVRELTAQMLTGGRLDTEGVKEVVRAMSGGVSSKPALDSAQARESFADAIRGLDEALHASSLATHSALQTLVARGKDFSDNDLKNAFAALQDQQKAYVAVADLIADVTTGNLRRELADLTLHAQRVGADASVRFAQVMSEFANRISTYRTGAAPGLDSVRHYGANMTMLTSGLLAGFADALRQQSETSKAK